MACMPVSKLGAAWWPERRRASGWFPEESHTCDHDPDPEDGVRYQPHVPRPDKPAQCQPDPTGHHQPAQPPAEDPCGEHHPTAKRGKGAHTDPGIGEPEVPHVKGEVGETRVDVGAAVAGGRPARVCEEKGREQCPEYERHGGSPGWLTFGAAEQQAEPDHEP